MRRYISMLCVLLMLLVCLCGCGGEDKPAAPQSPVSGNTSATDDTLEAGEEVVEYDLLTVDKLSDTYWKAVYLDASSTGYESHAMPWEGWSVDLFILSDGSSRFRSVMSDTYTDGAEFYSDSTWYIEADNNQLYITVWDTPEPLIGRMMDGKLYIDYNGTLCFEQAEMPNSGNEWCLADLEGAWQLETIEIEGYEYAASEEGRGGSICFHNDYSGITASYVQYDSYGWETSFNDAPVQYCDYALYDGCVNEKWSVQLLAEDGSEYYAAMIDRYTLQLMIFTYFDEDEYPAVCVETYWYQGTGAVG